jgi:coenzyme F420-0:L-glutamate ligase/coenzyme F420-1:gamma-L-glutamate ligase
VTAVDAPVQCAAKLEVFAIAGLPIVERGDDVPALVSRALAAAAFELRDGDVVAVTSKVLSRAEGRFVDLRSVKPSSRALELGAEIGKDPRVVELIVRESTRVSRKTRGALVVRHKLGFVCANAGIDASNARPKHAKDGEGEWVLLLPENPDASAAKIRAVLERESRAAIGVVVTDSFGRPFRIGTVGTAIGASGLPALADRRGEKDLFGRTLEQTITALADQVAAAPDLVAGQAAEARGLVVVRGLRFSPSDEGARALVRSPDEDVYA